MSIVKSLEKICLKMGEGNNAALVSASIAAAKGIFRPIFTMSDKKENMETKKYTAIREFLTEFIAIPVYLISGKIANAISNSIDNSARFVEEAKRTLNYEGKELTKEVLDKANQLRMDRMPKVRTNMAFFGVGLSALIIIPALCSAVIKPLMGVIQKPSDPPKAGLEPTSVPLTQTHTVQKARNFIYNDKYTQLSTFATQYSQPSGMKIGGV